MKLKVPNCLKKWNQPSYCNSGQNVETQRNERWHRHEGAPAPVRKDKESQGRVSCILAAHLLLSMCFFHTHLWFSSLAFRVACALCFPVSKMLRSAPSKAMNTGLLKSCAWERFPECTGASRSLFFIEKDVCNVSLGFVFDLIPSLNAKMQCPSLRVGKCKVVFLLSAIP